MPGLPNFISLSNFEHDVVEWLRAPDSSSGVSDQRSGGSSPSQRTCVLERDTLA